MGNTLFSVSGPEVWAVQHRNDARMDDVDNEVAELTGGGLGAAVGAIGEALADVDVELPERLHQWSTARGVPAACIPPGRPTLMVVTGRLHLALSWQYDTLLVTFAIVDNRWLTTVTPTTSGHVRVRPGGLGA
jgi:hypothetical protein